MIKSFRYLTAVLLLAGAAWGQQGPARWTEDKAQSWYATEPWLVGSNYMPTYAANQLEMWQADTFNAKRIDTELRWGQKLGMNTMRVFLDDLLWEQDQAGFTQRINTFLDICKKHKIKPVFVFFDSCWDPNPQLGQQKPPVPGVHNSRWVQSPGAKALGDPAQYPRLKAYVQGVIKAFGNDDRVLAWDMWNEPDNPNTSSYGKEEPANKVELIVALLPQTFEWAREAGATQPLTSGVWEGDWSDPSKLSPVAKIQLDQSDVVSFHCYGPPAEFEAKMKSLRQYRRPLICTEYMARGVNSTFQGTMPIAKASKVAVINWGFVQGKTQTNLPWDSWQQPYVNRAPAVWFHDIFLPNGKPYRPAEVAFIKKETKGH